MNFDTNPELPTAGLPLTHLQASKLGLMCANLLMKGYSLTANPDGRRPHITQQGDQVLSLVKKEDVPVGLLSLVKTDQVGYAATEFGLQFHFDATAFAKSEHWPAVENELPEEYVALARDGEALNDTIAPTREGAASEYFEGEFWLTADPQCLKPSSVMTARVNRPTLTSLATGYGEKVAEQICEQLVDYMEFADDARLAIGNSTEDLEAELMPVILSWLRRITGRQFDFYLLADEKETLDPAHGPTPQRTIQEAFERLREVTGNALDALDPVQADEGDA